MRLSYKSSKKQLLVGKGLKVPVRSGRLSKGVNNAEKHVYQIRARQHSDEELAHAAETYQQHRRALDGYQCISNAG